MAGSASEGQRSLRRALARLAPATLLVQIVSFGCSIVLATRLGATTMTDAYYLALSVPAAGYGVFIAAVQLGGIPMLTSVAHKDSSEEFARGCSELVTAIAVGAAALSAVATVVMIFVLPAAAGGSAELKSLTRTFMVELSPYAVTGALIGALGAILAVWGSFAAVSLALVVEPAVKSILVLLFHKQLGAQALVIGSVAGNFGSVALLWQLVRRKGVPLRLRAFGSSRLVVSVLMLSAPLVISQSVLQLNPLIDRAAAASLGPGTVTAFELGVRLFLAASTLVTGVIVAPLVATWSHRLTAGGWEDVTRSFARVVTVVVVVLLPVVVVGFLLRTHLVTIAYHSHAYPASAVAETADVFGTLVIALIPQVLIVPVATLFIIRKNTVFPMKVGIANCVINAILDVLLRGPLGVTGIALSTTMTLTVLCAVYLRAARRRWGSLGCEGVWRPMAISGAACVAIAIAGVVITRLLGPAASREQAIIGAAAVVLAAAAIYGSVIGAARAGWLSRLLDASKSTWLASAATATDAVGRPPA